MQNTKGPIARPLRVVDKLNLPGDSQTELRLPRAVNLTTDHAKGFLGGQVQARIVRLKVVQNVDELETGRNADSFLESEVLGYRAI